MQQAQHNARWTFAFLLELGKMARMGIDPAHPPIWLKKLHVTAAQITPSDYATTPEEGILAVCHLSDAHCELSLAFAQALGREPAPPWPPFDNPFRSEPAQLPQQTAPPRDGPKS